MARLGVAGRVLQLALVTMILLGPSACKRAVTSQSVPVWLGAVSVDVTGDSADLSALDREALAQQARGQLRQAGIFAGENQEQKEGVALATVRIGLAMESVKADDKAAARAMVRLQITTRPEGLAPARFAEDVRANAEMLYQPDTDSKTVFQRLAVQSISDLLTTYVGRQKLWIADRATLHASLQGQSELRADAARVVAARKVVEEVPALISLLADEDENVRDAALGALVILRDRRAVPALTKTRSMRDLREMGKIIEALAVIGGQEAQDYLAFVAGAHESEELRRLAASALRRVKEQAASKAGR